MDNNYLDELYQEKQDIKNIQEYANRFKLLTPEEEKELTQAMFHLKAFCVYSLLFRIGPSRAFGLALAKYKELGIELVNRNFRLALKNCQSPAYTNRGLPIFDLFMAAYDGLQYAAFIKYNPYKKSDKTGKTNKFSTYSTFWIKQRIGRTIENKGSTIKIAGHVQAIISKIKQVTKWYVSKTHGLRPSPETIVDLLHQKYPNHPALKDITPERVYELGSLQLGTTSLDEVVNSDEGSLSVIDYVPGPESYQPEVEYEEVDKRERIMQALDQLDDQERLVIAYLYGLIDSTPKSPKQIAKLIGITVKDVQKKQSSGLEKLKQLSKTGLFDGFY